MRIHIYTIENRRITLQVSPTTSILDIKTEIYNKTEIKIEEQRLLTYAEEELLDSKVIAEYPEIICENTSLYIRSSTKDILITVENRLKAENKYNISSRIEMQGTENIYTLKSIIEEKEGVKVEDQMLKLYNGLWLDDLQGNIGDYQVNNRLHVHLYQKEEIIHQEVGDVLDNIQINVLTLTGGKHSMTVRSSQSIIMLKNQIEEIEGVTFTGRIRLIYKGRELKDQYCIAESGIIDNSKLHICITGCFHSG